jgi:hypothetical protein
VSLVGSIPTRSRQIIGGHGVQGFSIILQWKITGSLNGESSEADGALQLHWTYDDRMD